jgi:excisionase family DNA binding protein
LILVFPRQPVSQANEVLVTESWVTLAEVATHMQVAEETIHRWIRRKGLPATRAGRNWRFKLSQVNAWLQSGAAAPSLEEAKDGVHGPA